MPGVWKKQWLMDRFTQKWHFDERVGYNSENFLSTGNSWNKLPLIFTTCQFPEFVSKEWIDMSFSSCIKENWIRIDQEIDFDIKKLLYLNEEPSLKFGVLGVLEFC